MACARSHTAIADPQRLAAVRATGLLNSVPEESLDRLTRVATRAVHAKVAIVSLADEQRQFLKSIRGLIEPAASLRELPLANSLCEQVVDSGKPALIADARKHPVGSASPEVRDLHLAAYLGVPLIAADQRCLGVFCVANFESREWSKDELETICDLAAAAVDEISLRDRTTTTGQSATEERIRLVLDRLGGGEWEWDLVKHRQRWSSGVYKLFGRDEHAGPLGFEEFVTHIVHPDDRSVVMSTCAGPMNAGEPIRRIDLEFRIIRPDGAIVTVGLIGLLEQSGSGQPARGFGFIRDITARTRAEQLQIENARFIHKLVAVAPYHIFVFDLDTGRWIYGNRTLHGLLGYDGETEDTDVAVADALRHPDDRERSVAYRQALRDLPEDAVGELECRFRRADGTWGWYLVRNAPFARHADGRVSQVVSMMADITTLKSTQEQLQRLNADLEQRVAARTAELSRANRELESFAHSVSHDLRSPLRSITGFSNMLREQYGAQLGPDGQRYLERVSDAAERMSQIIDALLKFSRAAKAEVARTRVDLSALARNITTELQRTDPNRKVEMVIADNLIATGDPVLLGIVLENLLGNAWKFTSTREHARIELGAQPGQNGQTFFVRDNGVGFDMQRAGQLFTPFTRLHSANEFPGTGIGLATVQRIITRHAGRIWVDSAPGVGTTFYFTLRGTT